MRIIINQLQRPFLTFNWFFYVFLYFYLYFHELISGQGQQPQFSSQPSFTGIGIDVSGSDAFDNSGFASGKPLEKAETKVAVAQAPPSVASDMVNRSFTSVATAGTQICM